MSTFVFILVLAGIAYLVLFNKPKHVSETDIQQWFSSKLAAIADKLERDIELDKKGEYPHQGKESFDKRGMIVYTLVDKSFRRLEISDKNMISSLDIIETDGYHMLDKKVGELDLSIRLNEVEVDGDDVQSYEELDEYIDDFPRYYTVTIGGW